MQTLAEKATRVLAWEQTDMSNGVFKVANARWLSEPPDMTDWVDCSCTAQLREEVEMALELLGEYMIGIWIGMGISISGMCHGIAWQV